MDEAEVGVIFSVDTSLNNVRDVTFTAVQERVVKVSYILTPFCLDLSSPHTVADSLAKSTSATRQRNQHSLQPERDVVLPRRR